MEDRGREDRVGAAVGDRGDMSAGEAAPPDAMTGTLTRDR